MWSGEEDDKNVALKYASGNYQGSYFGSASLVSGPIAYVVQHKDLLNVVKTKEVIKQLGMGTFASKL